MPARKRPVPLFVNRNVRAKYSGNKGGWAMYKRGRLGTQTRRVLRLRKKTRFLKKVHQRARALPNRSGSDSTYRIMLKPLGLAAKVANKMQDSTQTTNSSGIISTGPGLQVVTDMCNLCGKADIQQMLTTAKLENVSATGGATTKIFVKSCFAELAIQNSSNATVRIQIWNTLPKRDIYQDDTGTTLTPTNVFSHGLKEQTPGGTGNEYLIVGSRPTDSKLFNDYFKVKKVIYVDLAPGQTHYHRLTYKIDRFVANELIQANNLTSLKGWELNNMVIAYGEPVGDGTGTGATTESLRLHAIASKTYHFSWIKSNESLSSNINQLSTSAQPNLENLVTGASAPWAGVT